VGGNGGVSQQTKPHTLIVKGMVARRPGQHKGRFTRGQHLIYPI
jgi:hypothetical protein